MVAQHQQRFDWPDVNCVAPIRVKGLGGAGNKPWRMLRAAFVLTNSGENPCSPYVQLLDGGGFLLGEWWAFVASTGAAVIGAQALARVTFDTGALVRQGLDAEGVFILRVPIPPDLIVMDTHTLLFGLNGAQAAEMDVQETVPAGGLMLTYLLED